MRAALPCLLLASFSLAFAPAPFPKPGRGNLLVNGSFEEGPTITNWAALNAGSTEVNGWVVTRSQIDVVGGYWRAAHGKRSIDLHGSPGLGGVSQTFETTPGRPYLVRFSLAANPDTSVPKKVMGVSATGKTGEFTFDGTGKTRTNVGWRTKTWRFTATQKQTTLELCTLMTSDASCGPVIDDVQVCETR